MAELNLVAGKTYVDGFGKKTKVSPATIGDLAQRGFVGDNGILYSPRGEAVAVGECEPRLNLVEEWSNKRLDLGVFGKRTPSTTYTTVTEGMCLVALSGLSGEVLNLADLENGKQISIAHAVTAMKAVFEHGTTVGVRTTPLPTGGEPISFEYTNYRGETSIRKAVPISIRWGSTEWHPEPGYLFKMFDMEKQAIREFALNDCNFIQQ